MTALRGVQGGYVLARSPELISVGEVLRVLEGSTAIVDCVGTTGTDCSNVCSCSARPLWLKLQRRIDDVLNTTATLRMITLLKWKGIKTTNETCIYGQCGNHRAQ